MSEIGTVPPPYVLALGVCDLIYRDRSTGKRSMLGCFSVLHAAEFPAVHPALCVYLDLTNGRGQVTIKVQIIDSDELHDPIWVAESLVDFVDPRMVAELDLIVGGLRFPEAGEYRVQVFADNQFILERRLLVNRIGSQL
jgi:hypothetical protein